MNMEENNNISLGSIEDSEVVANSNAIKLSGENDNIIKDCRSCIEDNKSKQLTIEQIEKYGFIYAVGEKPKHNNDSSGIYLKGIYWLAYRKHLNFELRIGMADNIYFTGSIGLEEEFVGILKKLNLYGRK